MGPEYWKRERDAQPIGTPEYWEADRRVRAAEYDEERRKRALNGTYGHAEAITRTHCLILIALFALIPIFVLVVIIVYETH